MLFQLGNIIFDGLFAPESLHHSDSTTYATHNRVSGKPFLQPIANDLEEISLSLKLRAEYCDPTSVVGILKTSKDRFEVLPLLTGNGLYYGDFVIVSISKVINQCFDDGTVIESVLDISLKEFASSDKLLQQQQAARKQGFAVAKRPVNTGLRQILTPPQLASKNISVVSSETKSIDNQVINYENNTSQQTFISKDIEKSIDNIQGHIDDYNKQIATFQEKIGGDYTTIQQAVVTMQNAVGGFTFPVTSLADLKQNNLTLQSACNSLRGANTVIDLNVIIRKL